MVALIVCISKKTRAVIVKSVTSTTKNAINFFAFVSVPYRLIRKVAAQETIDECPDGILQQLVVDFGRWPSRILPYGSRSFSANFSVCVERVVAKERLTDCIKPTASFVITGRTICSAVLLKRK